jgi:hypothetical protein
LARVRTELPFAVFTVWLPLGVRPPPAGPPFALAVDGALLPVGALLLAVLGALLLAVAGPVLLAVVGAVFAAVADPVLLAVVGPVFAAPEVVGPVFAAPDVVGLLLLAVLALADPVLLAAGVLLFA